MNVCRGEGGGLSDHFLMVGGWRSARGLEGMISVLKVSELNES